MLKPLLLTATMFLIALAACTDPAPTSEIPETPLPSPVAATPALIPNTPIPEPTATTVPRPTETPAPVPPEAPSALPTMDQDTLLPSLSEDELACIGEDPEMMIAALTGNRPASREERARLTQCLEDDTVGQRFMTAIIPVPLNRETSDCVLAALKVIYPNAVMTTGLLEGDPKTAFAGSMAALSVYVACLNDEEWAAAAPRLGMQPEERDAMMCIMASLGGPAEMATAMAEAVMAEEVGEDTPLFDASLECGMEPRPEPTATPGLETATPTPMPMATTAAPRPTSAPPTPAHSPTPGATKATATPAPEPNRRAALVITVSEVPESIPEYNRDEWRHWTDENGDCQDARQEVLIAESLEPVEYEDDRECRVEWGRWWAPHLGHHLENPRPHRRRPPCAAEERPQLWRVAMVAGEVKSSSPTISGDDAHLVAISAHGTTGAKGARGPGGVGAPGQRSVVPITPLDWAGIKQGWGPDHDPTVESEIVMDMLHTCEDPPRVEVETLEAMTVTGVDKPTPEPEGTVYASCEDAADSRRRASAREAGAEEKDSRRRWCRVRGTGTAMEWCVRLNAQGREGNSMLSKFLTALFPYLENEPYRSECWLARAARSEREELDILSEALILVERHGELDTLATKVKREHPSDGDHQVQHDERVLDCLSEACAFAWSTMRGIREPSFCDEQGSPDIQFDHGNWIEVKAIRRSEEDKERMERMLGGEMDQGAVRMPAPGLYRKFDSALDDALKKFRRQNSGDLPQTNIVFFNLTTVDVPNMANIEGHQRKPCKVG